MPMNNTQYTKEELLTDMKHVNGFPLRSLVMPALTLMGTCAASRVVGMPIGLSLLFGLAAGVATLTKQAKNCKQKLHRIVQHAGQKKTAFNKNTVNSCINRQTLFNGFHLFAPVMASVIADAVITNFIDPSIKSMISEKPIMHAVYPIVASGFFTNLALTARSQIRTSLHHVLPVIDPNGNEKQITTTAAPIARKKKLSPHQPCAKELPPALTKLLP